MAPGSVGTKQCGAIVLIVLIIIMFVPKSDDTTKYSHKLILVPSSVGLK